VVEQRIAANRNRIAADNLSAAAASESVKAEIRAILREKSPLERDGFVRRTDDPNIVAEVAEVPLALGLVSEPATWHTTAIC
jgi:hypothetical protein